jgi:hypothetical protein
MRSPAARPAVFTVYPGSTVGPTPYGSGLFASRDLEAGTPVAKYEGPVMAFADIPEEGIAYAILDTNDRWLVPESDARYINHSCEPNCEVLESLEVIATQPVGAGSELTILYNDVTMAEFISPPSSHFWDRRWTFQCRCGSTQCPGLIDRYIARPPDDPNSSMVRLGLTRTKGRGVFARRPIRAGEVIERAPVLVVPAADWKAMEKTVAYNYTFAWGRDGEDAAFALGYGSLYNHSYTPNARFDRDHEGLVIEFIAIHDIALDEEILVNYNEDPGDCAPLWFPAE